METWNLKLSNGTNHLYIACEYWNACHMALELKEKQFPNTEITGIEKHSEDVIEGAWSYPFNI
jgi:hypothetical protein